MLSNNNNELKDNFLTHDTNNNLNNTNRTTENYSSDKNAYSLIESKTTIAAAGTTINNIILIYLIGIIGNIGGGLISEIKGIGRKYSEILLLFLTIISGFLSIVASNKFSLWMGISNSFLGAAFNIHIIYTEEIYPTKIRDLAFGVLIGMSRVGGFTSQFIFMAFNKAPVFFAVWTYLVFLGIMVFLMFFLPKDNTSNIDAKIEFDDCKNLNTSEEDITILKEEEDENHKFVVKKKE